MKNPPRVGTSAERQVTVEEMHSIRFGESGLAVLSTPWLVWFLEHAALDAAVPSLEAGEITVGIHVAVDHLAPTPVGCPSRLPGQGRAYRRARDFLSARSLG